MKRPDRIRAEMSLWRRFRPPFWDRAISEPEPLNYRRLWKATFWSAVAVTLAPLVFLAGINFYQFEKQYRLQRNQITNQTQRLLATTRVQIAHFLDERRAALTYVNLDNTFPELNDIDNLGGVFRRLRQAFGGFVDLGLIDRNGIQQVYIGPYNLQGHDYRSEDWYKEVLIRGIYISDVFLGHRNFPHFVIAIRHERENEPPYVLRATIDTDRLNELLRAGDSPSAGDVFMVNQRGILQTPSRLYGSVLTSFPFSDLSKAAPEDILDTEGPAGQPRLIGLAKVADSPFFVVVVNQPQAILQKWDLLRVNVLIMVLISVAAILGVVWRGSTNLVNRIFEADLRRAAMLHEAEYTNKLASIGRLAAGVAHEINNPVAIINEKVGLMKDLLQLSGDFPHRDKFLKQAVVIQDSVKRVSDITHRLLGFARHLPVKTEEIHLEILLREVLGFLGREAEYRGVHIYLEIPPDLPPVEGDKGQLQQVFLNIINNALAAVLDGGEIRIGVEQQAPGRISVRISDNGIGIPQENLKSIFDPFFSTKGERGTGLGLSITYGIVQKMGGSIEVQSTPGSGTVFSVTIPLKQGAKSPEDQLLPAENRNKR